MYTNFNDLLVMDVVARVSFQKTSSHELFPHWIIALIFDKCTVIPLPLVILYSTTVGEFTRLHTKLLPHT